MVFFHSFCESTKLSISHSHKTERKLKELARNKSCCEPVLLHNVIYIYIYIYIHSHRAHLQGEAKILALELNSC